MIKKLAPRRLGDDARHHLEGVAVEIRASAERAATCAAADDADTLRLELRLIALASVSALETLMAMSQADERAETCRAA